MSAVHDLRDIMFEGDDSALRPRTSARAARRPGETRVALEARRDARDDIALDPLLRFVLEHAGLDADAYRPRPLQRRAEACLRRLRVTSRAEALAMVERDASSLANALSTVLIGVSDFFRDREVFHAIERQVLPELLRTAPGLRVCSVGASTGQELYSMAILLTEMGALTRSDLIGIDFRADAMREASLGWYATLPGVGAERRHAYFEPSTGGWRVLGALRDRTSWRVGDVFNLTLGGPADVLLFRNVAIYLDQRRAVAAWERLAANLAPRGVLVTGKAERPPAQLGFARVGPCLFRKP